MGPSAGAETSCASSALDCMKTSVMRQPKRSILNSPAKLSMAMAAMLRWAVLLEGAGEPGRAPEAPEMPGRGALVEIGMLD